MADFCVFLAPFSEQSRYDLNRKQKTKGYKMLKNYKNWLIEKGFSAFTASNKPSTVYDYLRGLKCVCAWENKTIEQLADSISEIAPMYYKSGIHCVKGRMISRSVRCSLKKFNQFVLEQRA